jgi:hypothetical protein
VAAADLQSSLDAFLARWSHAAASERANAQLFLTELTELLDVPRPGNDHAGGYSFEFPVKIPTGPSEHTPGFLDLYRRGCFVLEAKQFVAPKAEQTSLELAAVASGAESAGKKKAGPIRGSDAWDDAMWRAKGQAERYARHLPEGEPAAPFLLLVDVEPLRAEWEAVRAAALVHAQKGDLKKSRAEVNAFHDRLCGLTVLDPACGSGNFLYIALQHLKLLEGEVLVAAAEFGETFKLELETHTIDPHQFLGLELNPRAASIAELVLWIGYLQWHFKIHGERTPPEPIVRAFKNIQCRDAVLAWDGEPVPERRAAPESGGYRAVDAADGSGHGSDRALPSTPGEIVTVWDRRSMKTDLVTGREVPDETKRVPLLTYPNARPAAWPKADYIVGNPPFLGKLKVRQDLGDGYAETLRAAYPEVPESADFVMYWWHKAAALVRAGAVRRFGLITTNSLRQTFNRRVVEGHLKVVPDFSRPNLPQAEPVPALAKGASPENTCAFSQKNAVPTKVGDYFASPLSLLFAIPDHPWVDTAEGAAVRIAMTVGAAGEHPGELRTTTAEEPHDDGSSVVTFTAQTGRIAADLTTGADLTATVPLKSNQGLTSMGVMLAGRGFVLEAEEAAALVQAHPQALGTVLRPLSNGKDLLDESRGAWVIDFTGLTVEQARGQHPELFQIVLTRVKPERDANRDAQFREKWWLFGRWRQELRDMTRGLPRYIAAVETAKHRVFHLLDASVLPEHSLIGFGLDDAFFLGVLSSRFHVVFALAAGGTLEDRPRYNKTRCFDPFPFPACDEAAKARIRALGEELDAHRKRVQAQHPGSASGSGQALSLTAMYNVLEKLRAADRTDVAAVYDRRTSPGKGGRPGPAEPPAPGGHRPPLQLTPKEQAIHDAGLVSVLRQLHDELDAAVAAAYGWPDLVAGFTEPGHNDAEILTRLVALNAARAAEEATGQIRWLRPEYQRMKDEGGRMKAEQTALALTAGQPLHPSSFKLHPSKTPWPKPLAERVAAVERALAAAASPVTPAQLAKRFLRAKPEDLAEILETLATLGRAHRAGEKFSS